MTPKEKANNLCMRFLIQTTTDIPYAINKTIAKECALIAVDEIAKCTKYEKQQFENDRFSEDYWNEVQKEIEKL
jgi:hypothetical protein